MINSKTLKIIKSTVPFLKSNGVSITKRFYINLFNAHPELKNTFNMASQASGSQPQSLAASIFNFASYIENPELLKEMVTKISQKHAGLEVKKNQYPIVGKYLLKSIEEELNGNENTSEIINAWEEAYNFLANILMEAENKIYHENKTVSGGWSGFKTFVISKISIETKEVKSFYFIPEDEGQLPNYLPGQSISVRLKSPNSPNTQIRNYTLSDQSNGVFYKITVKKTNPKIDSSPEGIVSNFLHNNVEIGNKLQIHMPVGSFTMDINSDNPTVFISNGIGITPTISMLNTMVAQKNNPKVLFINCAENSSLQLFKNHLEKVGASNPSIKVHVTYSKPLKEDILGADYQKEGKLDILSISPPKNANYYICGSFEFMNTIISTLESYGITKEQIKFEGFGPTTNFHCPHSAKENTLSEMNTI